MSITLTQKQEQGLRIAVERYKQGKKFTVISGFAGSGKSTLIKFIIEALNVDPEDDVAYVAFTGKAANVLNQKGCPNAVTAHKLLYYAKPMPNGSYVFRAKPKLEVPYKVIVVDEVSMLPRPMWELLLTHNAYILATGDPGQLPPIDKEMDNHALDDPHIFLDEIMRQAQDSEIIRLSMHIRSGLDISSFQCAGEQVKIFDKNEIVSGMYDWADQIICATNSKRISINDFVRKQKGFGVEPCVGDKIISLKNHWDFSSVEGAQALTNGSIGTIDSFNVQNIYAPPWIYKGPIPYMFTNMSLEDGDYFSNIPIDYTALKTGKGLLDNKQIYNLNKSNKHIGAPYDFAYAYAITCHKAQGSEWEKVLVFEEWFPNVSEEHMRWLYTACTRASEKLVIVKK